MTHLLDRYEPATADLARTMSAALDTSIAPGSSQDCGRRAAVLRVSDESRKKFLNNIDADLDWLMWSPEAAWVKATVSDVEMFRPGPAGDRSRAKVGMQALHAAGTQRLIGGWLARGNWLFVFLLSSAAKADLPRAANAATEAIKALLLALAHDDPHDQAGRPRLYAHALDRILRNERFAWQVFDTLTHTYVVVDAAGQAFDALDPGAKQAWTLICLGASQGRDDTARRFVVSRLNKARAGNWPGNENGMPVGFCPSVDADATGRFNLAPTAKQRHVSRPVPDPRARWAVRTIAEVYAHPAVTTWAAAAAECGRRGITSRGIDELGEKLTELEDKTSAGRLLLTLDKIRAYTTGLLAHTETGVTPGQFSPGDGHHLRPRWDGDDLGTVTYDVHVGTPDEHGWSWDVPAGTWAHILRKFWLPASFEPQGWSWADAPTGWGWDQITAACTRPKRQPTGRHAANRRQRPFSGLLRWEAGGQRHLVYCAASTHPVAVERYVWRSEPLAAARRNRQTGEPYRMGASDGQATCSWPVEEFHTEYAALAQEVLEQMLATEPEVGGSRLLPDPLPGSRQMANDAVKAHRRRCAELRGKAAEHRDDARTLRLSAAHHRRAGNAAKADAYDADADASDARADDVERQATKLEASPPAPPVTTPADVADFGTPAAVIGALTGAYAAGPAPVSLQEALREFGAGLTRLELVDATTVRLTVTVQVRRPDGTLATNTGSRILRRSRPNSAAPSSKAQRLAAKRDLARAWFYDGLDLSELTKRSGAASDHTLRIVREYLATGTIRSVGQAEMERLAADRLPAEALRGAITSHPVPAARAAVWCALNPSDPLPDGLPDSWAALVAGTYRSPVGTGWGRGRYRLDATSDHRLDAVTVLRALPDPTAALLPSALAGLMSIGTRDINNISRDMHRGSLITPATLTRTVPSQLTDSTLDAAQQYAVALPRCPWPDCGSPVADALVLLPELLLGCHSSVLCRHCLRPPTRNIAFPDAYRALADRPARAGTWVQCASGCKLDLGAGPGLLWRWDDSSTRYASAHQSCTGPTRQPTTAEVRSWAAIQGLPIKIHGRIPAAILRQFDAAQQGA